MPIDNNKSAGNFSDKIISVKDNFNKIFELKGDVVSIGFPINPLIKNSVFPNNYLIYNNQVLEDNLQELTGSVVEIHFQTLSDYQDLNKEEKESLKNYIIKLREQGFKLMIHLPFMIQKSDTVFDFDYAWLVVPSKYRDGIRFISKIAGKENYGREIGIDFCKDFLHFCDFLEIAPLTIHVTKPGLLLFDDDVNQFKEKIKELADYAAEHKLNVKIAIETGGLKPEHLLEVCKECDVKINLDTAHLVLDLEVMHPQFSHFKLNDLVTTFFKKNYQHIPQLHLTQTKCGDQHLPISDQGIITCNKDVLRLMQKFHKEGIDFHTMIESNITFRDREYVKEAIEDIQYFGYGNAVVNILMGWPLAGKSTCAEILKNLIGEMVSSDDERENYKESFSKNSVVDESKKELVYSELLDKLNWNIQKGNPGANIEATFCLKSRRKRLFDILAIHQIKDIYIWHLERNEDDLKSRINERYNQKTECDKKGQQYPDYILFDYNIYKEFMFDDGLQEKPEMFNNNEIPEKLKQTIHILNYNTSTQTITLYNRDQILDKGSRFIAEYVEKKYSCKVTIKTSILK